MLPKMTIYIFLRAFFISSTQRVNSTYLFEYLSKKKINFYELTALLWREAYCRKYIPSLCPYFNIKTTDSLPLVFPSQHNI